MTDIKQVFRLAPLTVLLLACAGQAMALSPQAILTIDSYDASGNALNWTENVSDLIVVDSSTGNIAMKQGQVGDTYRNTPTDPDFWAWTANANGVGGYWNWHSAQTTTVTNADGTTSTPWMTVVNLEKVLGHGDPDLSYGFYAKNNTASTQTYSLSIGESIVPVVSGANVVYADFGASLSNPSGSLTIAPVSGYIQQFSLSSDNGASFVKAGVDVGTAFTTAALGTSTYLATSPTVNGPLAPSSATPWNFMQITTKFTLSPNKDVASVSGYASINPVTPVPEPSSSAMMMAGLGMLGFMARRRRT